MEGFAGKVAVVTGAGSGIGQALAIELGRSGASLAISDVDTEGLAQTEEKLKAIGAPVKADRLDVTERERFLLYADEVNEHFGKVNQIYNNAGIAHTGDVEVEQFKDIERVMDVDFWGVVNGTKAFLPHLIASGDGHVINISSVFGLFSVPGHSAYNSAKFAVRGYTEALRQEMMAARHPVGVTTVHPGGIKTAIARNATVAEGLDVTSWPSCSTSGWPTPARSEPHEIILEAVRKDRARVLVGPDAKVLDLLVRVTGSGYQRIVELIISRLIPPKQQPTEVNGHTTVMTSAASGAGTDPAEEEVLAPATPEPKRCRLATTTFQGRKLPPSIQRPSGCSANQPSATACGSAPAATLRRISASAAVSSTPAISLIASSWRVLSALRRYSGTTFSA